MDLLVADEDQPPTEFHTHIPEGEGGLGLQPVRPGRMTKRRAHACKEFVDPKWFGDIIVGPEIERRNLLLFLLSRRKHDDRRRRPLPHLTNHFCALHVWEAQVEENEIGVS